MACCETLNGVTLDCDANIGGIQRAWIACRDNITSPTITSDEISALGTPVSEWKEYEFYKQTGSFTIDFNIDATSGRLNRWETSIVLQFSKLETTKRIEIQALAMTDSVVIIQDNNGHYWYFGLDFPVRLTEDSNGTTGTAWDDFNGYSLTMLDVQKQHPYEVTADAMKAILNPTPPTP